MGVQLARRNLVPTPRASHKTEGAIVFQVHIQSTSWEQSGSPSAATAATAPRRTRDEASPALAGFMGMQVLTAAKGGNTRNVGQAPFELDQIPAKFRSRAHPILGYCCPTFLFSPLNAAPPLIPPLPLRGPGIRNLGRKARSGARTSRRSASSCHREGGTPRNGSHKVRPHGDTPASRARRCA